MRRIMNPPLGYAMPHAIEVGADSSAYAKKKIQLSQRFHWYLCGWSQDADYFLGQQDGHNWLLL